MGEPPSSAPTPNHSGERLESWKEIAAFLKRDVTTVQRWEKREGMPVHRHFHQKAGSVHALRPELDAWVRSRNESTDPVLPPPLARSHWAWLRVTLAMLIVATVVEVWWRRAQPVWRNPMAGVKFQMLTEFNGNEQAATISPNGRDVAFLSDRDGQPDVWITQIGSGQFHNLTHGRVADLTNPAVRTLAFSPDGKLVTFWHRQQVPSGTAETAVWAVPILGGQSRPYLPGVAEFAWSPDGSRLAYHTSLPGDPLYVTSGQTPATARPCFSAAPGLHNHFPIW
ncbi:MAG: TolB family protein, partial [Terriglobales bacterium]